VVDLAIDMSDVSVGDVRIDRWRVADRPGPSRGPSASAISGIHGPSACEDPVQPEGDKLGKRNYRASADRLRGVTKADSR
jgi:hypothetical protein